MVGQLRVAHGLAEQVQVTGGVGGGDVLQQAARVLGAPPGQLVVARVEGGLVGRGGGEVAQTAQERLLLGHGVEAPDRGAAADAPGVPGHHVEAGAQLRREQPGPLAAGPEAFHAGSAGTAEVHEQGADPVARVGGGEFDQGEADLRR